MPCSRGCAIPAFLQQGGLLLRGLLQGGCSGGSALEGSAPGGGLLPGGVWRPPRKQTATVADGTLPTGMHSCFSSKFLKAMLKTFVTMNPHLHVTVGRISDEQQSEKILCLNKESSQDVSQPGGGKGGLYRYIIKTPNHCHNNKRFHLDIFHSF